MIVHEYETIYISRPELPGEEQERLGDRFRSAIEGQSGTILSEAVWGNRKLAYPIKKHNMGHYTYVNFVGSNAVPIELERIVRLEENLIRFMTVRLVENADAETLKAGAEQRAANIADRLAQANEDERGMSSSRLEYKGPRAEPPAESPAEGAKAEAEEAKAAPEAEEKEAAPAPEANDDASAAPEDANPTPETDDDAE